MAFLYEHNCRGSGGRHGSHRSISPVPMARSVMRLLTSGPIAVRTGCSFPDGRLGGLRRSLIIASKYGDEAVANFWKLQAGVYFPRLTVKPALRRIALNSGVSYFKGAWIFRMLEAAIGAEGFHKP